VYELPLNASALISLDKVPEDLHKGKVHRERREREQESTGNTIPMIAHLKFTTPYEPSAGLNIIPTSSSYNLKR
jgi:hypothetical protein